MAQTTVPIPLIAYKHKLASEVMGKAFKMIPCGSTSYPTRQGALGRYPYQ